MSLASISDAFTSATDELRRALARVSYAALAIAVVLVGAGLGIWNSRRPPEIPTILITPFGYAYLGDPDESRPVVAATLTRFVENELIKGSAMNIRGARSDNPPGGGLDGLIELGAAARADYIVAGEIFDDGKQYTVTVRLIDRWDGDLLMGQDFVATDLDLVIWLQTMTDMAAESIFRELGPGMTEYLTSTNALLNPYCETATLLLSYHMWTMHNEEERASLYTVIKENLIADPYLREGYFIQSDWYWVAAIYGVLPPAPAEELLRTAIQFAEESEKTTNFVITEGIYHLVYETDVEAAMARFAEAYSAEPYYLPAARWYALTLAIAGRLTQAISILASMERYAPADPTLRLYQATFSYLAGDYEEALTYARQSISRNDEWIGLLQEGQALLALGRINEAIEALETSVSIQGSMQAPKAYLAMAYAMLGRTAEARELRANLRYETTDDPAHSRSPAMEAAVSVILDEHEHAIQMIEKAVAERDPMLWLLAQDPVVNLGPDMRAIIEPVLEVATGETVG